MASLDFMVAKSFIVIKDNKYDRSSQRPHIYNRKMLNINL